jgi:hypothetical protein
MSLWMPLETTLENRRQSLRRRQRRHLYTGEPRDAFEHEVGDPMPSVSTPRNTTYLAQMNLGMPLDTTLENRRQNTPYLAQVRLRMPLNTTLETNVKRFEAAKRRHI